MKSPSQRVADIYDEGPTLTPWEGDFLESIDCQEYDLTERQEEILKGIETKVGL